MEASAGPDHVFWSKLDAWSYRDAALLLCGFDPDRVRGLGIRLDGREVPAEFSEASKPDFDSSKAHFRAHPSTGAGSQGFEAKTPSHMDRC